MNDVFEQLAPLAQTKKQQTAVAKFIEKGFKFTRQPDAQKFTFLLLNLWYESTKRQILEHDKGKHDEAYIDAWVKANVNKTLSIIRSGETIASCKEDVVELAESLNDEYELNISLLYEYCRALLYTAETTQSQQELVAQTQNHIALLKDLYKKVNKIK